MYGGKKKRPLPYKGCYNSERQSLLHLPFLLWNKQIPLLCSALVSSVCKMGIIIPSLATWSHMNMPGWPRCIRGWSTGCCVISQHGDTSNEEDVRPFCSAIKGFATDLRTQVPCSDRQKGQIGPFLEKVDHPKVSVIFCIPCRAVGHFNANCHSLPCSEMYLIYSQ